MRGRCIPHVARAEARTYRIELACPGDLAALPEIEGEAAAMFEGWGVPGAVIEERSDVEDFRDAQEAGRVWVARGEADAPVGFAQVGYADGLPHLEEIDVRPAHGRRGVGRALLEAVAAWAREAGHPAITLTTFRDVPWNAPFYRRAGFRILARSQWTPDLVRLLRDEAARGLAPERRVAMRRDLAAP